MRRREVLVTGPRWLVQVGALLGLGLLDVGLAPLPLPPLGLAVAIGLLCLEPWNGWRIILLSLMYILFGGGLVIFILPLLILGLLAILRSQVRLDGLAAIVIGMGLAALGVLALMMVTLGGLEVSPRLLTALLLSSLTAGLTVVIGLLMRAPQYEILER